MNRTVTLAPSEYKKGAFPGISRFATHGVYFIQCPDEFRNGEIKTHILLTRKHSVPPHGDGHKHGNFVLPGGNTDDVPVATHPGANGSGKIKYISPEAPEANVLRESREEARIYKREVVLLHDYAEINQLPFRRSTIAVGFLKPKVPAEEYIKELGKRLKDIPPEKKEVSSIALVPMRLFGKEKIRTSISVYGSDNMRNKLRHVDKSEYDDFKDNSRKLVMTDKVNGLIIAKSFFIKLETEQIAPHYVAGDSIFEEETIKMGYPLHVLKAIGLASNIIKEMPLWARKNIPMIDRDIFLSSSGKCITRQAEKGVISSSLYGIGGRTSRGIL